MTDIRTPNGTYIFVDKLDDEQVRLNVFGGTFVQHVVITEQNIDDLIEALEAHTSPKDSRKALKDLVKDAIAEDRQEELTRKNEYSQAVLERLGWV